MMLTAAGTENEQPNAQANLRKVGGETISQSKLSAAFMTNSSRLTGTMMVYRHRISATKLKRLHIHCCHTAIALASSIRIIHGDVLEVLYDAAGRPGDLYIADRDRLSQTDLSTKRITAKAAAGRHN